MGGRCRCGWCCVVASDRARCWASTILVEVEDNDDPDSDGEESESGEEGEGEEEQEAGTEEEDEDDDDYTDDDEDEEEDDEDDDDECDPCKGLSAQMNDMFMGPDPKQAAMALKLANPASRVCGGWVRCCCCGKRAALISESSCRTLRRASCSSLARPTARPLCASWMR